MRLLRRVVSRKSEGPVCYPAPDSVAGDPPLPFFQRRVMKNKDRYWDCLDQAMEASHGGRTDEALAWLDQALIADPEGAEAHNGRGEILWDADQVDGDGLSEIVAGAWGASPNGILRAGQARLFLSPPAGDPVDPIFSTIAANATNVNFVGVSTITVTPKNLITGLDLGPGQRVFLDTTSGAMLGLTVDQGDGTYTQVWQADPGSADLEGVEVALAEPDPEGRERSQLERFGVEVIQQASVLLGP